ncbi:hypothetical protein BC835DRAFT_1266986, partial [Cytidiella melzeri]
DLNIKTGLKSSGKTCFSTVYISGCSLHTNMPAIKALCNSKTVKLKNFVDGFPNGAFSAKLQELLVIVAAGAKATTCIELTHSTVSDVYVFWLATLAELHDIITDPHILMLNGVREDIRRIANFRWKAMMEQAPRDVYYTGFILDPHA